MDSNTAQVEAIRIRQIFAKAIIIVSAFKLPIERKVLTFSQTIYKTKTLFLSSPRQEKKRKWLRGHRGHLNCFILKQTRHVIKIPQDALIKLAKLIQIIFTHLQLKHTETHQ